MSENGVKWIQIGRTIDPNGPPPSPSPTSSNVSCQGTNKLEQKIVVGEIFYDFDEKHQINTVPGGLKRGPREKYNRRFPEGCKQRKSNNDDKHDHGPARIKGDPR